MTSSLSRVAIRTGAAAGATVAGWRALRTAGVRARNRNIPRGQRIVILGAGFAGLNVAQELCRLLPDGRDGQITLVDQNNFLLFTPMLTEVAGGELDPRHIVVPPRRLSHRINFVQAQVHDVDLANRSVVLDAGPGASRRTLKASHIVIALGSVPDYHGIPGVEEHCLGIKSIQEAAAIRNRILRCLELASWEQDRAIRRELLTFVVAGGGYTGVETMAAINDLVRSEIQDYPELAGAEINTLLVEPGKRLLAELSADLAWFARKKLEEHGVQVLLNTKVTGVAPSHVQLEHGLRVPSRTVIWAGGITPSPLISRLDCPRGRRGGVVVDPYLAVPGHPGVWAIGDCAEIPMPDSKGTYAPTAQNATREGTLAARNIAAVLRGESPEPFTFEPIGELALVGRHSGVAKIYGQHFSGFLAWAMWRAIYLSKMPGMAQRSRILLDWILDLVFGRNIAELPPPSGSADKRVTAPLDESGRTQPVNR